MKATTTAKKQLWEQLQLKYNNTQNTDEIAYLMGEDVVEVVMWIDVINGVASAISKVGKGYEALMAWLKKLKNKRISTNSLEENLLRKVENIIDDLGGKLYTENDLKLLGYRLKAKYGVEIRLIDKELAYQKLPITKYGKTEWLRSKDLLTNWKVDSSYKCNIKQFV